MKLEKYFDKQLKRDCWRFDVTIAGTRFRRGKFPTKDAAEKAITGARMVAIAHDYSLPHDKVVISIEHLLSAFEKEPLSPQQRVVIAWFREGVKTSDSIEKLSRVDTAKLKSILVNRGCKPSTIQFYKATLYGLLNRAGEKFGALENWRPPRFPSIGRIESRSRVLQSDDLAKICAAWKRHDLYPHETTAARDLRLELFDLARLMLLTGARREELQQLTPRSIDWSNGWLTLRSGKVKRSRSVSLSQAARGLLKLRQNRSPIFSKFSSTVVIRICRRVGKQSGVEYGQTATGWTLHDWRRTAATVVESSGVPYSTVSAMLGHKQAGTTAVYARSTISNLILASEQLQKFCQEIDGMLDGLMSFMEHDEIRKIAN